MLNNQDNQKPKFNVNEMTSYFSNFGECAFGYELDFSDNKKLKYKDLSTEFVNNILYNYLKYKGKATTNQEYNVMSEEDPKIESFYKKDLEDAIKYIYGAVKYDLKDTFSLGDYSFNYDKKEDKYISIRTKSPNCTIKRFNGYFVDSVYFEDNEVYVDILFYNYLYETNSTGCFKLTYYGTKKYEQFTSSNSDIIKEHKENFLKYRFVFAQGKKSYVFDHVELVD